MHVAFAVSECVPFAKTGGLADVVGALPQEIVEAWATRLRFTYHFMLGCACASKGICRSGLAYVARSITVPFRYYNRFAGIVDGGMRDGVQFYFVDCPEMFDRAELYGPCGGEYPDNAERFGLFCRAVLEAAKQLGVPDVFHVHDWQAALIPVYLRTVYAADPALDAAATVLTIHNAAYQGKFPPKTTEHLLFPWDVFTMDKVEQFDRFNFLKGGVVFSDLLTTVSRRYAEEIQTPEFGEQLDGVLRDRARRSARHSERRGLWALGSGHGRQPGGALHAGEPGRQAGLPRRPAACLRVGERAGDDAGDWHRFAAGHAKGFRHCGADCRRAGWGAIWRLWRWARASRSTRILPRLGVPASGAGGCRRSAMTRRWPTRSKPARICS